MINVKGTKTQGQDTDPAKRFAFRSAPETSRTPLALALMFTALAAYLKSMFPGEARDMASASAPREDGNGAASADQVGTGKAAAVEAGIEEDEPASPEHNVQSFQITFGSGAVFESRPIVLLSPFLDRAATVPGTESVANDNDAAPPARIGFAGARSAGGGSAGGGGGGGAAPEREDEDDDTPNRAPRVTGPVYLMDVASAGALMIALGDLLGGAHDPDADVLSVRNLSVSGGTLTAHAQGWLFEPGPDLGPVTITYRISDGALGVVQKAHFSVVPDRQLIGTAEDDLIVGGDLSDEIEGREGDDSIDAGDGPDLVRGGAGNDHIVAGAGNDIIRGDDGDDIILGGPGNDRLHGGDGNDRILGGAGNDRIFGDAGDDVLFGEDGDDEVNGGTGNDWLSGGQGRDIVRGEEGDDYVLADADGADDFHDGGAGSDTIDYSLATQDLVIDAMTGIARSNEVGRDTISNFETLIGGSGDDTVIGSAADEEIHGGAGNDTIHDGGGSDSVFGGAGDDRVIAAADGADDRYAGGEGFDTLDYSAATDDLVIDLANGSATGISIGEDTICGFESVVGGQGDDRFVVGDQAATLTGGGGSNFFEFLVTEKGGAVVTLDHNIADFKVGDLIRVSKWDLFERVLDGIEDVFDEVYGQDLDAEDAPIRYRHETAGQIDRTVIEADLDRNDFYETTITLQGRFALVVIDTA